MQQQEAKTRKPRGIIAGQDVIDRFNARLSEMGISAHKLFQKHQGISNCVGYEILHGRSILPGKWERIARILGVTAPWLLKGIGPKEVISAPAVKSDAPEKLSEQKASEAKHTVPANGYAIVVDLSKYPELRDYLTRSAAEAFRAPDQQVLYLISEASKQTLWRDDFIAPEVRHG